MVIRYTSEQDIRDLKWEPPPGASRNKVYSLAGRKVKGEPALKLKLATCPSGFGCRVTSEGAKAFTLLVRHNGAQHLHTLGQWAGGQANGNVPEGCLSLRGAIDAAEILWQDIKKNGADPRPKRTLKIATPLATKPGVKTVADVLDEFVERYVIKEKKLRSAAKLKRNLDRLVLGRERVVEDGVAEYRGPATTRIGTTPISDLDRDHVTELLDAIADKHGLKMSDAILAALTKAFRWYQIRDKKFKTPIVPGMAKTSTTASARKRKLDADEIWDVWRCLAGWEGVECFPRVYKALLLTACRRSEIAEASWSEIVDETLVIPPSRYKTGVKLGDDFILPLTAPVLELIGERHWKGSAAPYIFTTTKGRAPYQDFEGGVTELKKRIAKLRKKEGRPAMKPWQTRDLRRSAMSLMTGNGVPRDHADAVLGHIIDGTAATYDRHDYFPEKKAALRKLAAVVESIVNPQASALAVAKFLTPPEMEGGQ